MSMKTDLATTGHVLASATCSKHDACSVEVLLTEQDMRCLAADPLNPEIVYAGMQGHGVLRSNDRGKTWRPVGLAGQIVKALAISRTQPGTVYAGTKPALLFVTRNGGASWTELASFRRIRSRWFWFSPAEKPYRAYVQAIALSPTDSQTIVVGIEAGAVVRSRDGGKTWTEHRRGALRDCHSLAFHCTNGDWVYEGGGIGAGVSISRDAGATWTQPRQGLDRHYGWAVAADPAQPEVWYASLAPGPRSAHSEHNAQAVIVRSIGGQHGSHSRAGSRSLSITCHMRCSPILRLLVMSIPAFPMARCGIRPLMARPGVACRSSLEPFTARCCCSRKRERTRERRKNR